MCCSNQHPPSCGGAPPSRCAVSYPATCASVKPKPETICVSFVKVAECQRRAVIHYHTLIRLDRSDDHRSMIGEPRTAVSGGELAALA
jgi:hypothetical protein